MRLKQIRGPNRQSQRRILREDKQVRNRKPSVGKRRGTSATAVTRPNASDAIRHLDGVTRQSSEPVLRIAARALSDYLG